MRKFLETQTEAHTNSLAKSVYTVCGILFVLLIVANFAITPKFEKEKQKKEWVAEANKQLESNQNNGIVPFIVGIVIVTVFLSKRK